MKFVGFWLLVLVAVLVPATASLATSLLYPTAAARAHDVESTKGEARADKHVLAKASHARMQPAKAKHSTKFHAVAHNDEPCEDEVPCGHCVNCVTCAVIAAAPPPEAPHCQIVVPPPPDRSGPRAEFLLTVQERPPRTT